MMHEEGYSQWRGGEHIETMQVRVSLCAKGQSQTRVRDKRDHLVAMSTHNSADMRLATIVPEDIIDLFKDGESRYPSRRLGPGVLPIRSILRLRLTRQRGGEGRGVAT